ncbi:MAG TPA: DUF2071 domain-containing protein [Holophagaceae bacterium]|nr:DUF2071 domain-containing protein [Holophagaceae bacterium]
MRVPAIQGLIRRRLLINFRVAPERLQPLLLAGLRPLAVDGWGIAGICLIRLEAVRPAGFPAWTGLSSENGAHRIAVAWEGGEGVYIPRRDTDAALNRLAGGRLFPGAQHRAAFEVAEADGRIGIRMDCADGQGSVAVEAAATETFPHGSVLGDLEAASRFFRRGSLGYSPDRRGQCLDGLELEAEDWSMQPLAVQSLTSTFFDDPRRFPPGSLALDSAFLMRDVAHRWVSRPPFPKA